MTYYRTKRAVEFTIDFGSDFCLCAMSFMHIFNDVRANKNILYKVDNLGNKLFVSCNINYRKEVEVYLSRFGGVITFEEEINRIAVVAQYSKSVWEEIHGDECEIDLIVEVN